jgi:hypothetical protein
MKKVCHQIQEYTQKDLAYASSCSCNGLMDAYVPKVAEE